MAHDAVWEALRARLATAQRRSEDAMVRFNMVIADVHTNIPLPDGTSRVQSAARAYRSAMWELMAAQDAMANYLMSGAVPKDLDSGAVN